MSCGEWLERLSASLDAALPEEERASTDSHIATCVGCQERVRWMRAVKHATARLSSREAPPGAVRARIESLLLKGHRPGRLRVAYRLAAGTLAIGVLAGLALRQRVDGPGQELAEELVGDHLRSVAEAMPTEVTTSDPQDVIRFFSGKIPFQPLAPRLAGTRLLGGRLCKIAGRRVELLFYRMDSGTVDSTLSLFVSDQALGSDTCRESRGLAVCGQRLRGLTLLLIGRGPPAELLRLLEGAAS